MNKYLKMTRDGFTLVELMVVVAIIGVLASIAVPQYSKFQAKARQSEVRIQLGAAYTILQTFAAENSTYTSCLGTVGLQRDGTKFYYSVGLSKLIAGASACMPGAANAAGACTTAQWKYDNTASTAVWIAQTSCIAADNINFFPNNIFEAGTPAGGAAHALIPETALDTGPVPTLVNSTNFTLGAAGWIHSKAINLDRWTMDQNKQILNVQSGLN